MRKLVARACSPCLSRLSSFFRPTPGVAVTFNAILHPEWQLKDDQEVCIRFGITELGDWKWDAITMAVTRKMYEYRVVCLFRITCF